MILPLALVFIGALFLLRNTGLLPLAAWDFTWPLVLIILGVAILVGRPTGLEAWVPKPSRKTRS
ncbi:MAG: DUF5668 domain-containing protein [bacterium]|nr:DUF5668 domain-containing protein [bacterium]